MKSYIDRKAFCGYLKKIYVKGGDSALDRYKKYLIKESSKKRLSLDKVNELEDMKITFDWWLTNVKKHINVDAIKRSQLEKQNAKDRQLINYFADKITREEMTINDIKSDTIRENVILLFQAMPFQEGAAMITSFNKLLKVATSEDVVYVTRVNQFNYQISQLRIDNKNKVVQIGCFTRNENITTKANIHTLICVLENRDHYRIVNQTWSK